MANGKMGLIGGAFDVAKRVGPWAGGLAGVCYAGAYVVYFIKNKDLSDLAQAFFGIGFAGLSLGLGRNTEITVASEAEKRRLVATMPPNSQIPEIQKEIAKQERGQ